MISAGYKSAYQQGYSDAMRDFRKKKKSDVSDGWIPVSSPKELPHDCDLLVTHGKSDASWVGTVYWDMTEWSDNVDDVTAYMRYPKPYQLKENEE